MTASGPSPAQGVVAYAVLGRRRLEPNDETLRRLGELGEVQFTQAETALALGVGEDVLERLFSKSIQARMAFQCGRLRTLEALRRAQFDLARSNASMAMFLGRTYLGQGEQRESGDGEGFDLSGAGRRLRDKVAAVAAASSSPGDREGD